MKVIHLKCGHKLSVSTWPSKSGLAKVRHHYKKFHPERMRKITKKSLATKRKRGLINPVGQKWIILWKKGGRVGSVGLTKKNLEELKRQFYLQLIQTDYTGSKHYNVLGVKKTGKKARLIRNRCNPKMWQCKRCRHKFLPKDLVYSKQAKGNVCYNCDSILSKRKLKRNPVGKLTVIYDKLLGIEAHKSHGKFKGQDFKHDFKHDTDAMVVGNPDGSLTIKSKKGKRLWRNFSY